MGTHLLEERKVAYGKGFKELGRDERGSSKADQFVIHSITDRILTMNSLSRKC